MFLIIIFFNKKLYRQFINIIYKGLWPLFLFDLKAQEI